VGSFIGQFREKTEIRYRVSLLEKEVVVWESVKNCCGCGTGTVQEPRGRGKLTFEAISRDW
jgi:hypothetical protein